MVTVDHSRIQKKIRILVRFLIGYMSDVLSPKFNAAATGELYHIETKQHGQEDTTTSYDLDSSFTHDIQTMP